jgi:hypothetical protein
VQNYKNKSSSRKVGTIILLTNALNTTEDHRLMFNVKCCVLLIRIKNIDYCA